MIVRATRPTVFIAVCASLIVAMPMAARGGEAARNDIWLVPPAASLTGEATLQDSSRTRPQYDQYRAALRSVKLGAFADAERRFAALVQDAPVGFLSEAAALGQAEAAMARGDAVRARDVYVQLSTRSLLSPDLVWMRLAEARRALGDRRGAADAWIHILSAHPSSPYAAQAAGAIDGLVTRHSAQAVQQYEAETKRAEALFAARRYADADAAFRRVLAYATSTTPERILVHIGGCEYFAKEYAAARRTLRPYLRHGRYQDQAQFFDAMSARGLGKHAEFEGLVERLVHAFPRSPWTSEALDQLATHFIQQNQDDRADDAFRTILRIWPAGAHAERAAWKVGWRAYRAKRYRDAIGVFARASADFPQSDSRPAYVYWSGRSLAAVGDRPASTARYSLVWNEYQHSFYGPLARAALQRLGDGTPGVSAAAAVRFASSPPPPPNGYVIRELIVAGAYDDALNEVKYAEAVWGTSPVMAATRAWLLNRQGDLQGAALTARRAYPRYISEHALSLPDDLLRVIYPLAYWPLIQEHARQHDLDPFVLAALIGQESMFNATIRSRAHAVGLTQLLPATAARYARVLGLRYSPGMLTDAGTNIQLGAAYFSDLIRSFGDLHLALASYNAGENRVRRWQTERPMFAADEFIDDIPFPETRGYVKRILAAAERYRQLYANEGNNVVGTPGVSQ